MELLIKNNLIELLKKLAIIDIINRLYFYMIKLFKYRNKYI